MSNWASGQAVSLLFERLLQQTLAQLNVVVELVPDFLDRLDLVLKVPQLQPRVGRLDVLQAEEPLGTLSWVLGLASLKVLTLSSS